MDAIKAALDAYETIGQLVRVSLPRARTNPHQTGKNTELLRPFLDSQYKAIRCPKYIIPTLEEKIH